MIFVRDEIITGCEFMKLFVMSMDLGEVDNCN